jgi:hypothetical protein
MIATPVFRRDVFGYVLADRGALGGNWFDDILAITREQNPARPSLLTGVNTLRSPAFAGRGLRRGRWRRR